MRPAVTNKVFGLSIARMWTHVSAMQQAIAYAVEYSSTDGHSLSTSNCSITTLWEVLHFENDLDHQTAARTDANILSIAQVVQRDFKAVAAGAGIVVYLESFVKSHVLDLNLVVE